MGTNKKKIFLGTDYAHSQLTDELLLETTRCWIFIMIAETENSKYCIDLLVLIFFLHLYTYPSEGIYKKCYLVQWKSRDMFYLIWKTSENWIICHLFELVYCQLLLKLMPIVCATLVLPEYATFNRFLQT